ncbi:MAG: MobA-like protein [Candidatus Aramenus sulfurataquae]|jgi:molybdenum cofactor cytidylyltransferase|uniref:4-diphosphocytidyl-2C-methyl-D-erythritol kinase n=2 Tax=Candidatus Aramenus sulfurataquae TaxID=1326980 RepID=W7L5J3_9CREN|nr:MAG: MobA-like protein [Candidatus Aramenus sulfurataquae]MCL7343619.1 nucleotidyltransferase family protein [Candidatus Aramenus sulfurataquae]
MRVGSVILAAGEGKRFGGNKLTVKVKGREIILRVLDAVPTAERVIVAGKYWKEVIELLKDEVIIYNPRWKEGLSTSLKLGVQFFYSYDALLVLLGDMPLITRDLTAKIVSSYRDSCSAVVPTYKGEWGNPVLLGKPLFDEVLKLTGDVGAKAILPKRKDVCEVEVGKEVLIDVDRESDLALISEMLT